MWAQTARRSRALGRAAATPVPKLSVTQPRPSPLSLGHHAPQWPLCAAALVHTMWDCQPPQSTGPLLPLTPQQGNDWETRGPNKCPFVIPAWKLWRQYKLILVSKVAQTIVYECRLDRPLLKESLRRRRGQVRWRLGQSDALNQWRLNHIWERITYIASKATHKIVKRNCIHQIKNIYATHKTIWQSVATSWRYGINYSWWLVLSYLFGVVLILVNCELNEQHASTNCRWSRTFSLLIHGSHTCVCLFSQKNHLLESKVLHNEDWNVEQLDWQSKVFISRST